MNMLKRRIEASSDGLRLAMLISEPVGEPKGIVQIVHGMCEHKERYIPFMEYLSAPSTTIGGTERPCSTKRISGICTKEDGGLLWRTSNWFRMRSRHLIQHCHIRYSDTAWGQWLCARSQSVTMTASTLCSSADARATIRPAARDACWPA